MRCGGRLRQYRCRLAVGHPDNHITASGHTWRTPRAEGGRPFPRYPRSHQIIDHLRRNGVRARSLGMPAPGQYKINLEPFQDRDDFTDLMEKWGFQLAKGPRRFLVVDP